MEAWRVRRAEYVLERASKWKWKALR